MTRPRQLLVLVALAVGLVVDGRPKPADADPARPTDYSSFITSVEPVLPDGVRLSVVGGDAFLELQVARGHTAEVPDYDQGRGVDPLPYLRFRADGVVEQNDESIAAVINDGRFGGEPGGPMPFAQPRWRVVARDGRFAWHDHRIHWMARQAPTAVDDRGRVDLGSDDGTWGVGLVIDGEPVTVRGELLVLEAPSVVPWVVLAAGIALGTVAAVAQSRRRGRPPPHTSLATGLLGVGLAATTVAGVAWQGVPQGTGPTASSTLLAGMAAILAGATVATLRSRRLGPARVTMAGTAAALGSWALLRRDVLSHAWLPTALPFGVDRAVTAIALGAAAGAAAVLVWRPPTDSPSPARP